ncbi:MAG TPA: hemerythrin domain-containing protein [Acidimicrobiales bacterium]|nr:hemerythrin domain-containing protein [Acidimicrobiales bacterium]
MDRREGGTGSGGGPRAPLPSEVRAEVLAQHEALRSRLAAARLAAYEMLDGRPPAPALRDEVLRLAVEMEVHLGFEERMLAPVLAALDAWGPERAERLRTEHAKQRGELAAFVSCCDGDGWRARSFAERVRLFVVELLEDMAIEETLLLDPAVLRDDLVVPDQTDG